MGDGKGDVDLAAGVVRRGSWHLACGQALSCRRARKQQQHRPTAHVIGAHPCPRRAGRARPMTCSVERARANRGRRHRARSREWRQIGCGHVIPFRWHRAAAPCPRSMPPMAVEGVARLKILQAEVGKDEILAGDTGLRRGQRSPALMPAKAASQTGTISQGCRVEIITQSDRSGGSQHLCRAGDRDHYPRAASGPIADAPRFPRWPPIRPPAHHAERRCRPCPLSP